MVAPVYNRDMDTKETDATDAKQQLADVAHCMDPDLREHLHLRLAPCAPDTYWASVVAGIGADEADVLLIDAGAADQ